MDLKLSRLQKWLLTPIYVLNCIVLIALSILNGYHLPTPAMMALAALILILSRLLTR